MTEYGDDITKEEAVNILLDMYHELRTEDMAENQNKCVALMMGLTALSWISVDQLYVLAPLYWNNDKMEGTS